MTRGMELVENVLLYLFTADGDKPPPKAGCRGFEPQLWLMAPNKTKPNQTFAVPVFLSFRAGQGGVSSGVLVPSPEPWRTVTWREPSPLGSLLLAAHTGLELHR